MSEANVIERCEIFATGTHRGKSYTDADLATIARNFMEFSAPGSRRRMLNVPMVVGHEEDQELLKRSDLPAAGWASRVWAERSRLFADFADVADEIARLIRAKRYRSVSAEIYDAPPDGIPATGKMLRRVAILGAQQPEVKGLGDIPTPRRYSESYQRFATTPATRLILRRVEQLPSGAYACYSELAHENEGVMKLRDDFMPDSAPLQGGASSPGGPGGPPGMSGKRDTLVQKLAEHGMDTAALENLPEPALAEMLRVLEAKAGEQPPGMPGMPPGEEPEEGLPSESDIPPDENDWPSPADESDRARFSERARKFYERSRRHHERATRFHERARKYKERYCGMGEDEDEERRRRAERMGTGGVMNFSEDQIIALADQLAPLLEAKLADRLDGKARATITQLNKFSEDLTAAEKRRGVDAFIDRMVREGRLAPALREQTRDRLMRADCKSVIHKFSEGGKTLELTEYDLQTRELEKQPTLFSERFASPTSATGSDDVEVAKVEQHYEMFAEQFDQLNTTKDEFVGAFTARRKRDRKFTAKQYLEPAGHA